MSQYNLETIDYTRIRKELIEIVEHWRIPANFFSTEKNKRKGRKPRLQKKLLVVNYNNL